jgi:hypothetical protein
MISILAHTIGDDGSTSCQMIHEVIFVCIISGATIISCDTTEKVAKKPNIGLITALFHLNHLYLVPTSLDVESILKTW